MESGFEDDFAPMQSSTGKTATIDDDSLILGDEDSPKKTSEGKLTHSLNDDVGIKNEPK